MRKFIGFIMAETSVTFFRASENDSVMFQTYKLILSFMNLSPACKVLVVEELCQFLVPVYVHYEFKFVTVILRIKVI